MKGQNMKRRMAAALCAAMLLAQNAAYAEAAPLVEAIVPEEKSEPALVEAIVPEVKSEPAIVEAIVPEVKSEPVLVEAIVPETKREPALIEVIAPEEKSEPETVEAAAPQTETEEAEEQSQVEAIVPEGEKPEAPKPKLTIGASVSGMTISVTLSGNQNAAVDAMITAPDGSYDLRENLSDSASFTYTAPSAGTYNIYAEYRQGGGSCEINVEVAAPQTPPENAPTDDPTDVPADVPTDVPTDTPTDAPSGDDQAELITPPPAQENPPQEEPTTPPPSQSDAPTQPEAPSGQFAIDVSTAKGTISVTVKDALSQAVGVELTKPDGSSEWQTIASGNGTAVFTGLTAGEYSVYLDYMSPVSGVKAVEKTGILLETSADVPQTPAAGQFKVASSVSGDTVNVTVSEANAQEVTVVLVGPDHSTDVRTLSAGNGTIAFTGLAAGSYSVRVVYTAEVPGVSGVTHEGLVVAASAPTAGAIVATAQGGVNRVDVAVTAASKLPVGVTLLQGGAIKATQRIEAGVGSVSFTGLAAGNYTVSVDYAPSQPGVKPYQIDGIAVTASVAKIAIASVKGGENKLIVTGTAQPNTDITLTSEPAGAATIVRSGADGKFTAEIVLAAGTYTAVHAQYGADSASRVSAKGSFVVSAPLTRPPLAVDPIGEKDGTVLARTNPGTIVNLGTYDYGQTVTADARGMLQYSLPHYYPNGTKITFTVYYGNGKEFNYKVEVTVGQQTVYPLLKRGSKGGDVYNLTARLAELGYPVTITTTYTDSVVAAVRLFQKNNGLSVDGMAGALTQTALYSVTAVGYNESGVYPTFVRGDRGYALIYTLQQRLKDLGYYTIRVDGIYGSGTQRAVRDFQAVNGISATGKADNATQQLLYSSAAKPAGSAGSSSGSYQTLSRSSRYNAQVVTLQRRLKALGYLSGSVDGYFGSQTYRAVRAFQSRNGLTANGVADSYTQQVLYSSSAKAASGSSASSSVDTGYRLLYWGCQGEAVRRLQTALLNAGYKQVRTADGIYGQWTYDAVCAFQKANGLAVDGVAGKNTQNRLYGTNY